MKLILLLFVLATFSAYALGLSCVKCTRASSIAACDAEGKYDLCTMNQMCQTVVRKHDKGISVTKGCKQKKACQNNMAQCNKDQRSSRCTCCCDDEKCNKGKLNCIKRTYKPQARTLPVPPTAAVKQVTATCPQQTLLPHGEITCSDENKSGSTCEFRCTSPDYSLYPSEVEENTCTTIGMWSKPRPCCARPCPPFLLFDAAILYHTSDRRSLPVFPKIREATIGQRIDVNYDTAKFSGFYFNHKPVESTRYNYSEYENKTQVLNLIEERIKPSKTVAGLVNVGKAMWYAINFMFRPAMGARDNRVPKIMVIVLDSNSTDNVKAPSGAALRDNITPYVFAIEHEGRPLNRTQMTEMAGSEDRVYYVRGDNSNLSKFIDDLEADFCANPCVHVLHDHAP